mgnify:FL=1
MLFRSRYSWPVPPGYPFSFYAAFHSRWKIETAHVNGKTGALSRGEVDDLAQRFIFLVLRLTMSDLVPKSKRRPESWTSLAELVAAQIARGRTRARFWALRRAGLLAAPEFGLSVHAANEWLSSLLEVTDPKALREALSTERRRALENATGRTDVERLARSIDEASRSYKWVSAIEEAPLSSGPIA